MLSAIVLAAALTVTKADIEREIDGAFQRSEWTKQEKLAFGLSVAAHMLDLGSSLASDDRCVENNLILGNNPSDAALIGVKVITIGFEYWLYSHPGINNAHWFGYTSAAIHGYYGASNLRNDCY